VIAAAAAVVGEEVDNYELVAVAVVADEHVQAVVLPHNDHAPASTAVEVVVASVAEVGAVENAKVHNASYAPDAYVDPHSLADRDSTPDLKVPFGSFAAVVVAQTHIGVLHWRTVDLVREGGEVVPVGEVRTTGVGMAVVVRDLESLVGMY